jgi:hypothetical protein
MIILICTYSVKSRARSPKAARKKLLIFAPRRELPHNISI